MNTKTLTFLGIGLFIVVVAAVYFTNYYESVANTEAAVKQIDKSSEKVAINLPKLEEQNYKILNDRIVKLTKQINVLKSSDNSKISEEYEKAYKELELLKIKNNQLENLNSELNKKLTNENLLINADNKNSYVEEIKKLNEEVATYKSENDTLKLKLIDKESIVENLNSLISTLSNQKQMNEFEHDNIARNLQAELEKARVKLEADKKNNLDIIKENDVLRQRVDSLKGLEKANSELSKMNNELSIKILELNKELKALDKLITNLKNNKSSDITMLNLDNKNLQVKLEDAKTSILKLNHEKDEMQVKLNDMKTYKKKSEELKNELFHTKLEFEKYKSEQAKNINELSEKHQSSLDKINKELANLNELNSKLKKDIHDNKVAFKDLEIKNNELSLKLKSNEKTLKENTIKMDSNNKELQDALVENKKLKESMEISRKEKLELTSKITAISADFLKFKTDTQSSQKQTTSDLKNKLDESQKSYEDLNIKYLALKELNASSEEKLKAIKNEKISLENKIKDLREIAKNNENTERIIALEDDKKKLQDRINDLITKLNNKDESVKIEARNLNNLKLLETYTCDSIQSGETSLNKTCKQNIDKLLAKYNNNYLYEITPIIDGGGFKSLNAIDGKHMSSKEVKRLTRLANYGLSKDRVKSVYDYVKSKNKNILLSTNPEASYSKNNKKGFILRVYQ